MDLEELLCRLESLSRADRNTDADIAMALTLAPERAWWSIDYLKAGMIPTFTGSVDSALSLASEILGDHGRLSGYGRCSGNEKPFGCAIFNTSNYVDGDDAIGTGEHNLEPIAITIAVIRAVQTRKASA